VVGGQAQARRRLVRAANSLAQLVKKDKKAKKHKKDKKAKKHRRSSSSSSSSSSRSSSKGRAPKVEGKSDDRKEADTNEEAKPPGLENGRTEQVDALPKKDDQQAWQAWPKSKTWPVQGNAWPKKEEKEAWPKKEEKPQAQAWPKKEEKPQAVAWVWKAKATQCDVCEFRSYWGRGDCTTASCPIKKENSADQNKRHRMKAWLEKEQRKKEEAELQELALRADAQLRQDAQEVMAAKEARSSEDAQKAHLTVQPPTIQRNVR